MSMASDATKTMFEDMVKKVMMDMVIDNDPILVTVTKLSPLRKNQNQSKRDVAVPGSAES